MDRSKSTNVLVTNNQLVTGVSKVLLFGLAPFFPVENIYSSTKVGTFNRCSGCGTVMPMALCFDLAPFKISDKGA